MNVVIKFGGQFLWNVLSFFEKIYWYCWRIDQHGKFLKCGKDVFISRNCYLTNKTITIGDSVYIGKGCFFQSTISKIHIGNHVMFGPNVSLLGGNHRIDIMGRYMKDISILEKLPDNDKDIYIEDDVWLGFGVMITNGVRVGEGSIIGAGSVVTKDVPPYTILVGSKPQQFFPRWNEEDIKEHKRLLNYKD